MLDPRTKHSTTKVLTVADNRQIWKDIRDEIIAMLQRQAPINVDNNVQNNERAATGAALSLPLAKHIKRSLTVASFMSDDDSSSDEGDTVADDDAIFRSIDGQIERYKAEKQLKVIDKVTNKYNCPLLWWSQHSAMYPDIWNLANRILHIPATSAPAERVFSVASNVISNKRANLAPDNANVLIFLHDNAEFCE